jgi:hypothetical protein
MPTANKIIFNDIIKLGANLTILFAIIEIIGKIFEQNAPSIGVF